MKRDILRVIDRTAGAAIIVILAVYDRLKRMLGCVRSSENEPIRRILVIKIIGLGDTALMMTPLNILARHYPKAKISGLVTSLSSGILAGQPVLQELIIYDIFGQDRGLGGLLRTIKAIRARKFDCVIDFEHHFKLVTVIAYLSGARKRIGFYHKKKPVRRFLYTDRIFLNPDQHMLRSFCDLLRPLDIETPELDRLEQIHYSEQDEQYVREWLAERNLDANDTLVGIHVGSGPRAQSRRWDPVNFMQMIKRLTSERTCKVILTGSADEYEMIEKIVAATDRRMVFNCAGAMTLKQLSALFVKIDLVISNDTGPMHIAAAMGTPTIGLFGPNLPKRYAPYGTRNIAIYKGAPCSPCIDIHVGKVPHCSDPICMKRISLNDVWYAIEQQLKNRAAA